MNTKFLMLLMLLSFISVNLAAQDKQGGKQVVSSSYKALRSIKNPDSDIPYLIRGQRSLDVFFYDPADRISPDDSAMTIVTSGGQRLKRAYDDVIYTSWFGAKAGDGKDDWYELQKAINYVIAHNDKTKTLIFDGIGEYNLSAPLLCYDWNGTDYSPFQINLVGASDGKMPVASNAVQLTASFNDKFIIGLQKARASTVQNLILTGKYSPRLNDKQAWEGKRALWQNSSGRDANYSPYAAIMIDPFRHIPTEDGGYPGLKNYYRGRPSNGGSSGITIKNCQISRFVVGIGVSLNTTTLNADNINITDCRIESCMSAIAYGQHQTKGNFVRNLVVWDKTHTIIDCANYGLRDGYPPIVDGLNIAKLCHQIIDQRTNQAVPVVLKNVFAEGLFKIGRIVSGRQHVIRDSEFRFAQFVNENIGDADRILLASNVLFDGCALTVFGSANGGDSLRLNFSNQAFTFRNCVFNAPPITAETADVSNNQRATFYNCRGVLYGDFGNITGQSHDINASTKNTPLAVLSFSTTAGSAQAVNRFTYSDPLDVMVAVGNKLVIVDTVTRTAKIVMGGNTGILQRGDYIMSTFSSATKDSTLFETADKNPSIGRVMRVTNDTVYVSNVPVSVRRSGTRFLYMNYYRKLGAIFTGDVTRGQQTISNVEVYKNLWPVPGDRLESNSGVLSPGAFVTRVDRARATMTVSKAFSNSAQHVDFAMGNPEIKVTAYNSPDKVGGDIFHFRGAEWNIISNSNTDSIGEKYVILRSGPYNSSLHPHKSAKLKPEAPTADINPQRRAPENGPVVIAVSNARDQGYRVAAGDHFISLPRIAGDRTITLPPASANTGRSLLFWNKNTSGYAWKFSPAVINAAGRNIVNLRNQSIFKIVSDGTNWISLE